MAWISTGAETISTGRRDSELTGREVNHHETASSARERIQWSMLAALFVAFWICRERVTAQDAAGPNKKDTNASAQPSKKADESAVRLGEMTQIAHAFKFVTVDGARRAPAKLVADPLHRWTDPTRPFSGGALWIWKSGGRPVAVLGIELYAAWSLEFVSALDRLGRGPGWPDLVGGRKSSASNTKSSLAHSSPANDQTKRLRQMRDLVRRISASEFYDGKHYAAPACFLTRSTATTIRHLGVVDAARSSCMPTAQNPEVLFLIEARAKGQGLAGLVIRRRAAHSRPADTQMRWQGYLEQPNQGKYDSARYLLRRPQGARLPGP